MAKKGEAQIGAAHPYWAYVVEIDIFETGQRNVLVLAELKTIITSYPLNINKIQYLQ